MGWMTGTVMRTRTVDRGAAGVIVYIALEHGTHSKYVLVKYIRLYNNYDIHKDRFLQNIDKGLDCCSFTPHNFAG